MPNLEFVDTGDETGVPLVIGGIDVPGTYKESGGAGEQAPEHKVEEGYDFTTRVGPEPVTATFAIKCDAGTLAQLERLRLDRSEPFPVTVGTTQLTACVFDTDGLQHTETGDTWGALDVTVTVREIQQAASGSATVRVDASTGTKTSDSESDDSGPSIVNSDTQSTADGGGEVRNAVASYLDNTSAQPPV